MKKRILLIAASSMISLGFLDYLLYKLVPKPCNNVAPDKLVHHNLIPKKICNKKTLEFEVEYKVNSLGLRGEEFLPEKPEDEFRILFLGDSFIEGIGVSQDEVMSQKTEDNLMTNSQKNIKAINAGVSAYSPLLEYLYLKHRGINLEPDLVVVNLFMNDFNDDRSYLQKAHYDSSGEISGVYVELKQHLPSWLINYLDGRSFSYYLFKRNERQLWKFKGKVVAWLKGEPPPNYAKSGVDFIKGDPDRDPFAITRDIPDDVFDELFYPSMEIIRDMEKLLAKRQIPLVLVAIPAGHQVNDSQWVAGRKEMHLESEIYPDKIFHELAEFSRDNKLYFLDLTPGLRQYLKSNPSAIFYFDTDGHFTPLGHKVSADVLADFLKKSQLVD